jgi:hypothetical protein
VVAVLDDVKDRLIVFGKGALDRAWVLPLDGDGQWRVEGFSSSPTVQLDFSLAVDPAGRRLFAYTSGTASLWTVPLDGEGTWEKLAGPPQNDGYSCRNNLVFDGRNGRLLLLSGGWPRGQVFAFPLGQGGAWKQLQDSEAWYGYGASSVWDAQGRRFLVDGGQAGWVWSFAVDDATGQWTHLKVAGEGTGVRVDASSVYDDKRSRWLLFGGRDTNESLRNDEWALDLTAPAWATVAASDDAYYEGGGASLAAVPASDEVFRFGSFAYLPQATTRFDALKQRWISLGDAPVQGMGQAAGAWDAAAQRLVVFGGAGSGDPQGTRAFDPAKGTWTDLAPTGGEPPTRSNHAMLLDAKNDRMLVFGGWDARGAYVYYNDLWAYSMLANRWSKLDVPGGPSPREAHGAAFDDATGRLYVVGGLTAAGVASDVWVLEPKPAPHWSELSPGGDTLVVAGGVAAAFDPATKSLVVIGDAPNDNPGGALDVVTYTMSTEGAPAWKRGCARGLRPGGFDGAVATKSGVFVTSKGSTWRFDPSVATCD